MQTLMPSFIDIQTCDAHMAKSIFTAPFFLLSIVLHMLSHANWPHLIGNVAFGLPAMVYVEHMLGSKRMLQVFVLCGLASLFTHLYMPLEGMNGLVGSSGAISGLCGASCLLFARTREKAWLAGISLALFLIPQLTSLSISLLGSNIAYAAHIGGCIMGMLLIFNLRTNKRLI